MSSIYVYKHFVINTETSERKRFIATIIYIIEIYFNYIWKYIVIFFLYWMMCIVRIFFYSWENEVVVSNIPS